MLVEEIQFNKEKNKILKTLIDQKAKFLIKEQRSYINLCNILADFQLIVEKGYNNYSETEIINLGDKIFHSDISYEELCWLIANLFVFLNYDKICI